MQASNGLIANNHHNSWFRVCLVLALVMVDFLMLLVSYRFAYSIRFFSGLFIFTHLPEYGIYFGKLYLIGILWLLVFAVSGMYTYRREISVIDEGYLILKSVAFSSLLTMALTFIYRDASFSRLVLFLTFLLAVFFIFSARFALRKIQLYLRFRGYDIKRAAIIGATPTGKLIKNRIMRNLNYGYRFAGFITGFRDCDRSEEDTLGILSDIENVLNTHKLDEIIMTNPSLSRRNIARLIMQCDAYEVKFRFVPDLFEIITNPVGFDDLVGIPVIRLKEVTLKGYKFLIKRVMDIILSFIFIIISSPIMLLTALFIRLDSPGPVFFKQNRVGKNNRNFNMYKFRSMVANAEDIKESLSSMNEATGPIFKIKNDPRTTKFGKLIRRFSLDELPQFFNIFVGDMSLVGPRPPVPLEVDKYNIWHKKRLDVIPGLTGLWQISGRSELSFDEMVKLDLYYIENWSIFLDIKILLKTIPVLFTSRGAY